MDPIDQTQAVEPQPARQLQGVYRLLFYSAEADHPQVRGAGQRYIHKDGARLYSKVSGDGPQLIYVNSTTHEVTVPTGVAFERPWYLAPAGTSQFVEPQVTVVFNSLDF